MNYPQGKDFTDLATLQLAYDRLLHQAQHQAAFLGTASHELRSPINQIISLHQLILEDLCENPAEEREFVAQANQTIQTVLKYLDLLITLSKFDIGTAQPQLQPTLLGPLLTRVQRQVEMQCVNRQCRFSLGPVDADLTVSTDAAWLEQSLVMLIEAALVEGSPHISLTVADDSTPESIALHLDTNPAANPPSVVAALSPEFRYQLSARLIPHLGATLDTLEATSDRGQYLCLQLPQSIK
ncbi:sensor histidine kinase [Nodosilinea sp. E11]|uniref:sensor histidine kinase n=1 Tax=Nodosilinea sp. E11 TaxID=3037479 RepID=UPI002934ACF2|nr:histidine kinase dimerization/phospho-acceptor domain-containing protein [Nodosilinea sp. E11]WOD39084.1 histidine kinase dimerization/phospho-acceptor domain-containing protein [Nodosilinea sp. E11]